MTTIKTPNFDEFTEITDAEFKAFDPKIQREITMNQFDKVHLARMRDAIAEDPYKAMSQGFFGGEPIDEHNNGVYNFMRELARTSTRTVIDAPASAGLMIAAGAEIGVKNGDFEKLGITMSKEDRAALPDGLEALVGPDMSDIDFQKTKDKYIKRLSNNDERLKRWFGKNRDSFMSDVGGGAGSLLSLIGMSVVAGPMGATATAGIMGAESGANIYQEATAAGIDNEDAYSRAMDYALTEGMLERVGLGMLWKSAGTKITNKILRNMAKAGRGFVVEGSEEGLQQLAEEMTMRDVRGTSAWDIVKNVAYSAFIGGIVGAPAGVIEGGAVINPKLRQETVDKLVESGMDKSAAENFVDAVVSEFSDAKNIQGVASELIEDQLDTGQYPNGNYADAQKVWASMAQDAMDDARHDIDIRDDIKARTKGLDENTQNVVADAVQNFADVISDDFGITQREFLNQTGLQVSVENGSKVAAAVQFADGTRIDETGNLVDKNGNVLFQSAMYAAPQKSVQDFYNRVMKSSPSPKNKSYFVYTVGEQEVRIPFDTVRHDSNKHNVSAADWQSLLDNLDNVESATLSDRPVNKYGRMAALKVRAGDVVWAVGVSEHGYITTAFNTNENRTTEKSIDEWVKKNAPQRTANGQSNMLGGSLHDIIGQFRPDVKGKRFNQSAYAGSRVDYDAPSLEAIGTGEGNQSHGWGLYYALSPEVAESYRNLFIQRSQNYDIDEYEQTVERLGKDGAKAFWESELAKEKKEIELFGKSDVDEQTLYEILFFKQKRADKFERLIQMLKTDGKGQVVEVDIPEPPFLLDEQKPLSEQSEYVQNVLKDVFAEAGITDLGAESTGKEIYAALSEYHQSDKDASLMLKDHGIKGITYYGRADGRCFVIFDPADVRVVKKFYESDNDGDPRGYFDWTNKMQQVIQIMKSGDLDTVMHELGHFFSINYINAAIAADKTEKLQPLLEYYKVEHPAALIASTEIQEDLAVKFLSYLKTDQSPRGFRKYFDMVKDWLIKTWDSLKAKGLVQTDELPDEIVRFFDNITIRRPKNINLQNAANEKARLKKILHDARVGKLDGVSDADIHTIEELLKTATARIPRMPKSLYNKLWGQLNIKFAETHDLLQLMGIDEKAKYLATSKNGGIKDEQGLLEWLQDEGFIFGDGWSNNAAQDMMRWDDALRLIGNAKNTYSIDDAVRVQEIDNMRQAQEIARDVLDGQDSYNAMADIDNAKSAIQRVNDAVDRNKALNKALAADYKKLSAEVRKAKAGTSEMRKAVKTAVSFLYAQDIPTDLKAKFMRSLPMVHDSRSLAKWIAEVRDRAEKEYSDLAFRGQRDRLKHELQETYSPNKRNIKYDYEHNTLFNDLRQYNTLSAEKAQEEIQKFYDGDVEKSGLSREDELRKMMLEYRANLPRRQMSGAFMDELISRIQEAKLIGRDAIDEIQYHRGLERMEAREEILDAIAANKSGKLDKHFAGISDFKSLLNTITNSKIADKFNMVGREINAGIAAAARQQESIAEVLRINERGVSDNPRKNSYEFLKYKAELCEPIQELNVSYTDHHGRKVIVGVDNGKKVFSRAHIMDMYNQYKDPKSRELMDKFYGEWQMDQLFSYLTDQDKQTADYLMERLRDIYDMVNPVYVSLYQKDMPRKKIYWPRQSNHEIDHELLERFDGEAREANFTKSRSHGAIPVFNRDVFSNYQAHEKDAQYMVHQAKAFKDAADIFDDSTIKEAIKNKFGKEVAGELSEHLKALSIGGVRKARAVGDTVLNQFFGQIIGSKVNLSPFVMMKQLTSFGAFSANMPLGQYYKDFAQAVIAPRKTYRYMMEHAGEYLRNRYGRGVNETMAAMIDPTRQNFMDRVFGSANRAAFNEFLSRLVRTGDVGAIVYGGYPRLKFLIEEKDAAGNLVRTHDEAVNTFIKESEETQQSATNAAQSNWQRTGKTKVFAMYKTSQIQYFRRVANAYNQMKRGEITRGQFTKTAAIFTAQMAIGYKLMGDLLSAALFGWDDDKDFVDELGELAGAIITQVFDAWGAVGYFVNQAFGVMTDQKRQAELSLVGYSDVLQTINNANKIKNGKAGNAYFWVQTFAPLIEGTTGAPVSRYNRVLKKTGTYNALGI